MKEGGQKMWHRHFTGRVILQILALGGLAHVALGVANGPGAPSERGSGVAAPPAASLELANGQLAIRFDAASGAVTSIRNMAAGVDYTTGAPAPCLFGLKYFVGGADKRLRDLVPAPATLVGHTLAREGDVQTLRLDYRVSGGDGGMVNITCRAALADAANEVRWTIALENAARDMEIVEVTFPILGGLRIGRRTLDNFLVWPAWGGGRLIGDPQRNGKRAGTYAGGGATMAWMDLFCRPADPPRGAGDAVCGLYFGSHDPTLLMTGLGSQPSGDGNSLRLQMSKYAHVPRGESWASVEFVTQVHSGDWHAGADAYRAWFLGWSPPPDPPAWLRQCDGRLEWTLPLDGKGCFENDIVEKVALARQFGLNFARFGGQMIASVSAGKHRCNRFPFPDPLMGTESEFAAAIKTVRRQGAHVAFYINGQAWDPRWPRMPEGCAGKIPADVRIPDWEGGFNQNALLHYDGTLYAQYPKASGHWPAPPADGPHKCLFYFMCPASEGWAEHLRYWTVEKYVRQYGTDAMFLDQIGAESAKYCFNPAHGHRHHGAWTQGFVALAKRIKEEARRIDPDFTLETEGFGDAYAAYFDSFFIAPSSTGIWPDSCPEVARYTFPDSIFFDGFWRIQNPGNLRTAEETLNEVFLIGNRFLIYAQPEVLTPHTLRVINLRRRIKHVLYTARFMDDMGIASSDPTVRVKRFVLDGADRKVTLLTIHNRACAQGAKVDLDLGTLGPVREAAIATLGGDMRAVVPAASGNRASIPVPAETLSAALLVHRGSGIIDVARGATQLPVAPLAILDQ